MEVLLIVIYADSDPCSQASSKSSVVAREAGSTRIYLQGPAYEVTSLHKLWVRKTSTGEALSQRAPGARQTRRMKKMTYVKQSVCFTLCQCQEPLTAWVEMLCTSSVHFEELRRERS